MMHRLRLLLFVVSLTGLSWLGMMAFHEMGHVLAAVATGGKVDKVVLHPLAISRTDVSPNPWPAVVVWGGPLMGVAVPLGLLGVTPRSWLWARRSSWFFAGFCLIANGAYIGIGSFWGIGDCGEMLRTRTPQWVMVGFGAITISVGFWLWHHLGSLRELWQNNESVPPRVVWGTLFMLLAAIIASSQFFADS